jgi:hypothetical protein
MKSLTYEFDPLHNSPSEEYNDPLKTMFGRDSKDNLAREAIQNSIDAGIDPKKPVRVVFQLEKWKKEQKSFLASNPDFLEKVPASLKAKAMKYFPTEAASDTTTASTGTSLPTVSSFR